MKRFAKIILGAMGALVIVLVIALIGINLYLQSGGVQQRIRMATEQAIGMPVTVHRTVYTPWSGLTLSGLSLPDPTVPDATLVESPKFSVRFRFLPLLQRRFVISQVSLSAPHLTLRQTQDKKWIIVPSKPTASPSAKSAKESALAGAARPPAFAAELSNFYISKGSADIIDYKGARIARIDGMRVDGKITGNRIEGIVWIESIEIGDQFYPNHLRAEFVHENDLLSVTKVKVSLADGMMRGAFSVLMPRKAPPAFQLEGKITEGISIPTLIAEANGDRSGTSGKILGDLELRGNPLDASTIVGGGKLSLDSAQLRPFDIIQQVGMLLRVDELQLLKLRTAVLPFTIRDEKILVDDAILKTENLIITGRGAIKFSGKMNLEGQFLVNEKIQRELSMFIGDQFVPSASEPGYKEVSFTITGRTDRPQSNLLSRITGYQLGNMSGFGSLLKGFFGAPKHREPSPRPASEKAPAN